MIEGRIVPVKEMMHGWNNKPAEAVRLQRELSTKIQTSGSPAKIGIVAGVDVSTGGPDGLGHCCIVVLNFPGLEPVEESCHSGEVPFPYIPGLLSFREGPLFLRAFENLKNKPDVLIFDGQGIAHPRRFGIACHMGLLLGIPSIGCAKSRLYGSYEEPDEERGSTSPLLGNDGERIGTVLRTRSRVSPVFVSPGHLVGMDEAARIVLACTGKYRIPVPTRMAHILAGEKRKTYAG
ncbi:MAG TPA: deoxyribonuclease V [Spirochaetota bacterium]|nr:MAG: Endonuclease V [Spirochaetes bacterium ADurb.BinA120]HNU91434.1 deoxyribonuclease V [Spirochaetota bacterium]